MTDLAALSPPADDAPSPWPIRAFPVDLIDLVETWSVPGETLVATCERILVDQALARAGGNQVVAARLLRMAPWTLNRRMAKRALRPLDRAGAPTTTPTCTKK